MKLPLFRLFALLALVCSCASCAVGTATQGTPARSMPAARAALAPEYRIFYDTLQDYGDWVLIEPYGYLFRPRVQFHTWRPFESGFWAPSDSYGWVWISSEPFGWATYHYGRWFFDDFRGWVWQPGAQWGPAWVSWRANDQYAGWSPLGPGGGFRPLSANVPGGTYLYAPVDQLGSTDLQVSTAGELGTAVSDAAPVENIAEVEGVRVSLGPSIERVERLRGRPLPRVRIADLIGGDRDEGGAVRSEAAANVPAAPERPITLDETRRAGEEAARTARALRTSGGALPSRLPVVKAFGRVLSTARAATPDSARIKR